MKKCLTMSLFLILFLILFPLVSFAAVPGQINYQGVLKDNLGNLQTGNYQMRFVIYDGPGAGATDLWSETQSVTVEAGLYGVRLGSTPGKSIPPTIFEGNTLYLGVKVGADKEMEPRIPLITVPYAYRAVYADTVTYLDGLSAEAFVRLGPASTQETSAAYGINVKTTHSSGTGIRGEGTAFGGIFKANGIGVAGEGSLIGGSFNSDVGAAVYGTGTFAGGVFTASNGLGVSASSEKDHGISGTSNASGKAGVYGETTSGKNNIAAVYGKSSDSIGIYGESGAFRPEFPGVLGKNTASTLSLGGVGVRGESIYGAGVSGYSERSIGVRGDTGDANSYAGSFYGGRGIYSDNQVVGQKGILGGTSSNPVTNNQYGGYFVPVTPGRALGVNGDAYINGISYAKQHKPIGTNTLDIAEWVKVNDSSIGEGDVVVLDKNINKSFVKSSVSYSTLVAGIVSTDPAFLAGTHGTVEEPFSKEDMVAKGYRMLALAGQVPCKVSTENGPIERGDLLTTSNTPGYAMKATDPKIGTVLGKAMEPLAAGKGKIMVLVTLQ